MKHKTLQLLLKTCLSLRLYWCVSLLIVKISNQGLDLRTTDDNKSIKTQPQFNDVPSRPSIIAINKTGLLEDLHAIHRRAARENVDFPRIFVIPRYVVDIVGSHFLSEKQKNDFLDRDEWDETAHGKLNVCWKTILRHLKKRWNASMLVSANYSYGNERDAHNAAVEIGLKVIIIYKECFMSKGYSEDLLKVLRRSRKFHGTKLLLYNSGEVGRQLESGMARPDQLVVVGSPRFDAYISSSTKLVQIDKCKIVFFVHDIVPKDFAGYSSIERDRFDNFSNSQIDFGLCLMTAVAWSFPEIKFEIKTKVTIATIEKVEEWSKTVTVPPNLSIVMGGLSEGSLKNCLAAIGFNTTALVDAMASGVPIGVLNGDGLSDDIKHYVMDFGRGTMKLSSVQELENWISSILSSQDSSGNVHQSIDPKNFDFLIDAVGNADGNASLRALNEIISAI